MPPSALRYFVTAHPDDEIAAWALIEADPTHYVVFVLATRGEQTSYCDGHGFEPQTGEREPLPAGFGPKWGTHCPAQRIDSWHAFLDTMTGLGAAPLGTVAFVGHFEGEVLNGDPTPKRCDSADESVCAVSKGYDLWVGERSARMVFDLGDGDLSPDEVTWALQTARRIRAQRFPVTAEDDIVGGSYYVSAAAAAAGQGAKYDHPDHHSVHVALWNTDQGVPGPQWGRTGDLDPDRAPDGVWFMSPAAFEAAIRLDGAGPSAQRIGAFQVAYGWLWEGAWPYCEEFCFLSRKQVLWKRH